MPFLAPVFAAAAGAFAAASAWYATLGIVGTLLVQIGASVLLGAAARLFMPKQQEAQLRDRTVTVRAAAAPRDIVYGRVRKGGNIIYVNSRSNTILNLVVVLAGHNVNKIGAIYFDDDLAADEDGVPQGRYSGGLVVEKRLGAANQTAFSFSDAAWTSSHTIDGCAAIMLELTYSSSRYPNGIPNVSVDIEGKNDILDPRDGSRGYSVNSALCTADYMSLTDFSIGASIGSSDGVDSESLIEAANICDETVDVPGGGTESRYTCNGVMSLSISPKQIIEAMLGSMAGTAAWIGGAWKIRAGAYRIPTVTLNEHDIRTGGISLETRVSRADNANAVRGTFISPDNNWEVDDFPAYESATYRAEDGGERVWYDISLPFTISASMSQRLARIELEKIRRQMTVDLKGKLSAWRVSVGGTVLLDYSRWGISQKPFEVKSLTLELSNDERPELVPNLILRETSPSVYTWSASEAAIYAAAPRTNLPSAFDISPPGTPTVSEILYVTRDGAGVKVSAKVDWTASSNAFVEEYIVYASKGSDLVEVGRTSDVTFTILDIDPGVWNFSVKAVSLLGVSSSVVDISHEIFGLLHPPSILTGLNIQSAGGLAVLEWDRSPDVDVRINGSIIIRHSTDVSPTWTNSVSMKTVAGNMELAVVPLKPGSYILRAQDSSGILGPEIYISTDGIQVSAFSSITTLQENNTFTGTKNLTIKDETILRLAGAGDVDDIPNVDLLDNFDTYGGYDLSGTYNFATGIDFGLVKKVRLRSVIGSTVVSAGANMDTRAGSVDNWLNFDGEDGGEVDVEVQVRKTQTDPTASPTWSSWSRVDSSEVSAWGIQVRALLTSTDSQFSPAIEILKIEAEELT